MPTSRSEQAPDERSVRETSVQQGVHLSVKTILIVEDEHSIAEMLAAILVDADYRAVIAGNGQEALTRLETTSPDLILSDIMMPIMDGRTLCKKLQAHPAYRSIPVVLMSAAYDSVSRSDGKPTAFLKKPFGLQELLTTVSDIIGEGGEVQD
jgi:two-component system alkaline phosphatase synthesis response regulator PhoP